MFYAQEVNQIQDDPYIDQDAVEDYLRPAERNAFSQAFMVGIGYGLNPIAILAPAVSLGVYLDPIVFGLEISDSEPLGIWIKERKENFGTSRFSGVTNFVKWFYGENFYLMATFEQRTVKLWNRSYNRTGGRALFDMFINTTVSSFGAGLLRFNEFGFLGIDIIRLNFLKKGEVEVVEHWETWSILSGNRKPLDLNIEERSEKWMNILDSPTGFFVTFGVYF